MINRCNFESNKCVIFAPHVDDEVIGCSEVILDNNFKDIQVVYIFPEEESRLSEGKAMVDYVSEKLNKTIEVDYFPIEKNVIYTLDDIMTYVNNDEDKVLFFPTEQDKHPDHVLVGSWGTTLAQFTNIPIVFYTTRMNVKWCRRAKYPKKKRELLNFYASQKSLWKNDYKYFLFEGYCVWL